MLTRVGTGPEPFPGKFSVPGTESQIFLVTGTVLEFCVPQIWVPFSVPYPGFFINNALPVPVPKVLISVPVPFPEF